MAVLGVMLLVFGVIPLASALGGKRTAEIFISPGGEDGWTFYAPAGGRMHGMLESGGDRIEMLVFTEEQYWHFKAGKTSLSIFDGVGTRIAFDVQVPVEGNVHIVVREASGAPHDGEHVYLQLIRGWWIAEAAPLALGLLVPGAILVSVGAVGTRLSRAQTA